MTWSKNTLMLSTPRSNAKASASPLTQEEVATQKTAVRIAMSFARENKLRQYEGFIAQMLHPKATSRKKPITCLLADGMEIGADLLKARRAKSDEKRKELLSASIAPYLQIVTEKARCEFSGHKLSDIWRFFRFTWMNPPESTPGRTMLFLIRDAARINHPIMGLISLENAALRISSRDKLLGWDPEFIKDRIAECDCASDYEKQFNFLQTSIEQGLGDIDHTGLCEKTTITNPSTDEIKRITEIARKADQQLMVELEKWASESAGNRSEQSPLGNISSESEGLLYKRKRAESLSKLLKAKLTIQQLIDKNPIDKAAARLIGSESGTTAIRAALHANKNRHVGTSILELNVCGAIPPYNYILGGKLAALLALSPRVVEEYKNRYGSRPSDIASRMKGKDVIRPANLVYVGTTSLYSSGASQYSRLKIPQSLFGGEHDTLWEKIGETDGYGTLHIAQDTLAALEDAVTAKGTPSRSNHVFGEGASPKRRTISTGINAILANKQGATAKMLGRHEMHRLVFGAKIATNSLDVLSGTKTTPKYFFDDIDTNLGTQIIIDFWKSRWLGSRINHLPSLIAIGQFDKEKWLGTTFEPIKKVLDPPTMIKEEA